MDLGAILRTLLSDEPGIVNPQEVVNLLDIQYLASFIPASSIR